MRKIFLLIVILVLIFTVYKVGKKQPPQAPWEVNIPEVSETQKSGVIIQNLEIPWEIAFLPNGDMLVSERPGRLNVFGKEKTAFTVKEVFHTGEGGLLGMVLHPDYPKNKFLYLYYTYQDQGKTLNKVVRYVFNGKDLKEDKTIISGIAGFTNHDGGRIKFGPDRKLYITTGDAGNKPEAQNKDSLNGKILRLNDDGTVPADNPFPGSPIYAYGNRNPQGLAWDASGQLWSTEHGQTAHDEVNRIEAGKNYGWPLIQGNIKKVGMETPFIHSGNETWAPSGAAIKDNKLYFVGLAGRAIYVLDLGTKELRKFAEGQYGRIRTIVVGPDGNFYIATSNRDGRNTNPDPTDDRIIRLSSSFFN